MTTLHFAVLSRRTPRDRRRLRLAALVTLAAFATGPAASRAQVAADPNAGANRPRIDTTANGLPLVQITNPSAAGVSRNLYGEFNVERKGLVFNNSLALTQTELAGYVAANPFLKSPARLILNEVTGAGASQLQGYMEVAGNRADVVIANQNGITCNGCGFINAGRGTLTTGTPVFGGAGSLEALRVTGGGITVEGLGLNADNLDRVDLISRTLAINAGVWARELSVVTGPNLVLYPDASVTPVVGAGERPAVSLDVGALGGMYAGKIRLVGTEKGVGVVSRGTIASVGEFTLASDGNILLAGRTSSGEAMDIRTGGAFENQGTLYSADALRVEAGSLLANTSTVAAQGQLSLLAETIRTTGTLAAGVTPEGKVGQASYLLIAVRGGFEGGGGRLLAGGIVSIDAGSVNLAGATVQSGSDTYLTARNGGIAAGGASFQAGGDLVAVASGRFDGASGSILARNARIEASSIDLSNALVQSIGEATPGAGQGIRLLATNGDITAGGATLHAAGDLVAATGGAFAGAGGSLLAENLVIEAASIDLTSASAKAVAGMSLASASGGIAYRGGTAQANGDILVAAAGAFDSSGGTVVGANVQITAESMTTGTLSAGVMPDGAVVPDGQLVLVATNGVEAAGQRLMAGGIISIDAGSMDLAGATVQSGGHAFLTARTGGIAVAGARVETGANLLAESAGTFDGSGASLRAGYVQIVGGSIELGGAQVQSTGDALLVSTGGGIGVGASLLHAAGDVQVQARGALAGAQAQILAGKGAWIRAASLDLTGASVASTGSTELVSTGGVTTCGAPYTHEGATCTTTPGGDVSVRGASVQAGGTLTVGDLTGGGDPTVFAVNRALDAAEASLRGNDVIIAATSLRLGGTTVEAAGNLSVQQDGWGSLVNAGGKLLANGDLTLSSRGTFDNTGGTVMGANVRITAQDIRQQGEGAIIAATESVGLFPGASLLNADGARIYSFGSILVAGGVQLDANGQVQLIKTGDVTNSAATIEADGDLTIASAQITNRTVVLATAETPPSRQEAAGSGAGTMAQDPNGQWWWSWTDKVVTDTYQVVVTDSRTGSLEAGGNISLLAGSSGSGGITNDMGKIAAGGSIYAECAGSFVNRNSTPISITRQWKEGTREECASQNGPCGNPTHWTSSPVDLSTDMGNDAAAAAKYWKQRGGTSPASDDGKNQQIEQVTNGGSVAGPAGGDPSFHAPGGAGSGTAVPASSAPSFTFAVPQNGLYTVHGDPGYPYLVETDPRFANLQNFLSSEYMLAQLSINPDVTLKRLGDGFYEQRVVLDQVTELTGRRYLAGFADGEEEFKALMDAGVRYAAELKLEVGVALTAEQMSKLTSPMVWLVAEEVGGQKVLVPRLYLAGGQVERVNAAGMITAGNDIYLNMLGDFTDTGMVSAGGNLSIQARNVSSTGGSLSAGKALEIVAKQDVVLRASTLQARDDLLVTAREGDVSLTALSWTTRAGSFSGAGEYVNGQWSETTDTFGTTLGSSSGSVSVVAGKGVLLEGAQITASKDLLVLAQGGNVTLDGVVGSRTEESRASSGNLQSHERTRDETWKGTSLVAGNDVTVTALSKPGSQDGTTGNVFLRGATVQGNGTATIYGEHDVVTQEGREKHESLMETKSREYSFLGFVETVTTTRDEVNRDLAVKNQISGGAAVLRGEHDLTLRGADVVASGDVQLSAGRDVTVRAAEDRTSELHSRQVVTSGFLASGVGFTFGTRTERDTARIESTANVGSAVGSLNGSVDVSAGGDVFVQGSDILSKERTSISGQNVTIEALVDRQTVKQTTEVEQSGFGVSLGGGAVSAATAIHGAASRASEVKDDRLKALYALRAARTGVEVGKSLLDGAGATDGVSVQVGYGVSGNRTESVTSIGAVRGSLVQSEGEVSITATGEPDQVKGDLTVTGSAVQGRNVSLEASRDMVLQSAANTLEQATATSSYSASMGLSLGIGKGGGGLGVSAKGSLGKGDEDESNVSRAETTVEASEALSVKSGRDLTLRGAQAKGESIQADVGRDLLVESEQDTSTYHSKQVSVGAEATFNFLGAGGGASVTGNLSKTDSSFKSVAEQSGFYAGAGGFQIKVAGNTHLAGGVIASEAPEGKNLLDTGTLTWSNLENESQYSAMSVGATVGTGGVTPIVGVPAQDEKRGTTYAAVSPATIRTGSDVTGLSRDTAKANNAIGDIFDKEKVAEKQELGSVFGQEAYKAVGDLAQWRTKPFTDAQLKEELATKYRDLAGKPDQTADEATFVAQMESAGYSAQNVDAAITQAQAEQERYRGQYETWKDGSFAKVLLHAGAGAAQAGLGGGSILAGGVGAGASEGLAPVTESLSPQARQWASLGIGAFAGGLTGGTGGGALSGGATALTGYQFNRALHESEKAKIKELAKDYEKYGYKTEEEAEAALTQAACAMVHCAEQLRVDEPGRDEALAYQHGGDGLEKEKELLKQVSKEDYRRRLDHSFTTAAGSSNPFSVQKVDPLFEYDSIDTRMDDWLDAHVLQTRTGGALQVAGGVLGAVGTVYAAPRACATVVGCFSAAAIATVEADQIATGAMTVWQGTPYATSFNSTLQLMGLSPEVAAYVEAGAGALAGAWSLRAAAGAGTLGPQTIEVEALRAPRIAPLGRGSTANGVDRWLPRDLREQLAVQEAMQNPAGGTQILGALKDSRWPSQGGWVKMQRTIDSGGREGPVTVHYNYNRVTGDVDDFKIVQRAPEIPVPEPKMSPTGD